MSDDLDAALDVLRAELLAKMDEDRDGLVNLFFETLKIVAAQEEEISNLRAAVLNQLEGKYSEALQLLRAEQKNTAVKLIEALSQLRKLFQARQGR